MRSPRLRPLVLALVATVALAACGEDAEDVADAPVAPADAAADPVVEEDLVDEPVEAAGADDDAAMEGMDGTALAAADLRITLERLLGQHAVLAVEAMRAGVTGDSEFEQAAQALGRNTQDLTGAIELAYGAEGAQAFEQLWSNHIDLFVQYTQGVAAGDAAQQQQALDELAQYRRDFGSFLEAATDGGVTADAVASLLQEHVDQLTAQVEQFAAGDYPAAYATERTAYAHMFPTAKALAGAIAGQMPEAFPGAVEVAATDLRSTLGQLLGEHAVLAIAAMRNGVEGSADFAASAQALGANTVDLTAAIESVYGPEGGQTFEQLWSNHIDFFVQYTQALAAGDEAAKEEALANLAQYRQDFAAFVEAATDGEVPSAAVLDALEAHVEQLVSQIEQYHAGALSEAYATEYEAYTHMYDTAAALAGGIAAQMPEQFPQS